MPKESLGIDTWTAVGVSKVCGSPADCITCMEVQGMAEGAMNE